MTHRQAESGTIGFTFSYAGHGWANAEITDGVSSYAAMPSYVLADPLFALMHALVEVLCYGGTASCTWFYEPRLDHWHLRREEDTLHIDIVGDDGTLRFSTTCDMWRFASKVHLAASRLMESGKLYRDAASVRSTGEYRVLHDLIQEHKQMRRRISAK